MLSGTRNSPLLQELWHWIIDSVTSSGVLKTAVVFISIPATFIFCWVAVTYTRMLWQRRTLPPGPFPLPLVGNCLHLSRRKPWDQFKQWSRENGNGLLTIWIGRTPTIICNDAWSASDLMEKRSQIYSSRPHYVVLGELTGQSNRNLVFLPYNDKWRNQRRIMHMALGTQSLNGYKPFMADESRVMIRDLLHDPEKFRNHLERYAGSLISILGWGRRMDSIDDHILKFALKMMDQLTMMQVPGNFWMDAIPELQYLPGWLYALPNELRGFGTVLRKFWWALDLEGAAKEQDNFSKTLVNSQEKYNLTPEDIGELTATLIGGGLDTTSSSLHTFVLAMCLFPNAQKAAQAEIDSVVGQDRSPDWDDVAHLPYCEALYKESMRWRSVAAFGGFAHAPIKDDVYKGYRIPAGIAIYGNLWAIHSNPEDFPDPDDFRPQRFLEEASDSRPFPNKSGHQSFGWGRRSCSGQYFAEQSLSMSMIRLLWSFDIKPGLDDEGNELKLDKDAYTDNTNAQPLPFKARFMSRSEKIERIIRDEAEAARNRLKVWNGVSDVTLEQFM